MSTATKTAYTPEDLLVMRDGDRYELVNGELVESNMSMKAAYVAALILRLLGAFCDTGRLGWLFGEGTTYQCFPHALGRVRKPDVSFIRLARLTREEYEEAGHVTVLPDLAVEVLSPHDTAYEVDQKIQDYQRAKVPLIWKVNPDVRNVMVYRADGTTALLTENDEITGENILPGFRCHVRDFFRLPDA